MDIQTGSQRGRPLPSPSLFALLSKLIEGISQHSIFPTKLARHQHELMDLPTSGSEGNVPSFLTNFRRNYSLDQKMMGRGAEGGTDQLIGSSNVPSSTLGEDIYSQVLKEVAADSVSRENLEQLGERAFSLSDASCTLKGAALLDNIRKIRVKNTQPRSRESRPVNKQSHHVDEPGAAGEGPRGQFWTQTEDYFRELSTQDVQLLLPTTSLDLTDSGNVSDPCLVIPPIGQHYTERWAEEDFQQAKIAAEPTVPRLKRKLPTAGSISKKSKKCGELITIISPAPEHEDGEELCHVCNSGDSDESNQILFCDICNVAVHQDCYGVRVVPEGQWLCSWCTWGASKKVENSTAECLLCPLQGGALKPVVEVDSKDTVGRKGMKFAHLFCSQWVPETFIGNMEAMEPIRNIEGVRDERWRLLCSICKEKQGACIQCSHGMCATAFHPLCAREAMFYMEVFSMEESEDVEYRAYCSRHSAAHMGKASVTLNERTGAGTSQLKLTAVVEKSIGASDSPGTGPSESNIQITDNTSKEQRTPSSSVVHFHSYHGGKGSAGQPQIDPSHVEGSALDASTSIQTAVQGNSVEHQGSKLSGPSGEGLGSFPPIRQEQEFEQTYVAANPSLQSWEASQPSRPDNSKSLKPEVGSSCVKPCDEIEGKGDLPVSSHLLHPMDEGSRGQDSSAMAYGDASGEVTPGWDDTGIEERRQHALSGEASTSQSHATSLSDSPAVCARTSKTPSTKKTHGKEATDPITRFGVSEEFSHTGNIHVNMQPGNGPTTDAFQAYAHQQIVQRLRLFQQNSGSLRLLSDSDHHFAVSKSSTPPTGPLEAASESLEKQWEQLKAAERAGLLKMAPGDEIEGEILVLQNMVLNCAEENRRRCEELIGKLMPKLAAERLSSSRRVQDQAFVHCYMSQKREARKQGRKEKRNKEAQAVLAAATAAAAASPRVGYIKRDALSLSDTDIQPPSPSQGFTVGHSSMHHLKPPVPRLSNTTSISPNLSHLSARSGFQARSGTALAVLRTTSEQLQLEGEESACDICNNRESSRANKIVACNSCKVNVHQECYGVGRIPQGAWFCQPCAELQRQSQSLRSPGIGAQANMLWAQCALCCRGAGALKRSTDGRWVHVFCAQWMPETSTGRDQAALIQGMENVNPERFALLCSVCRRQEGACLTCNFGHCHGAFHPPCARDAGLYMTVRVSAGGRFQYRAYCDKHSSVQRAKDEQVEQRQRSGNEDLHVLRQIRVGFERVRLMCERVCRRERLKRDILQTNKENGLAQLMCAAYPETANLEQPSAALEANRIDPSTVAKEVSMASIQQVAGSEPHNSMTDVNPGDETKGHIKRHKKFKKEQHGYTRLHREQLMTPLEASILNRRLPKGYAYVPVDVYVKGTITPTQAEPLDKEQQLPPTSPGP